MLMRPCFHRFADRHAAVVWLCWECCGAGGARSIGRAAEMVALVLRRKRSRCPVQGGRIPTLGSCCGSHLAAVRVRLGAPHVHVTSDLAWRRLMRSSPSCCAQVSSLTPATRSCSPLGPLMRYSNSSRRSCLVTFTDPVRHIARDCRLE
jgi:hypothetical protein